MGKEVQYQLKCVYTLYLFEVTVTTGINKVTHVMPFHRVHHH